MNNQLEQIVSTIRNDHQTLASIAGVSPEVTQKAMEHTRRVSMGQTPSRKWQPMVQHTTAPEGGIVYKNDLYMATLRRYQAGWPFNGGPWAQIGIWVQDGNARHDWRDYQRIKNDLVGAEWEAIELYPAESRLIDSSNYYILYCAPAIPIGKYESRTILGPHNCIAPQRGWANGDEPPEAR